MTTPVITCDECGSPFLEGTSRMMALCPECAHVLYGHPPCQHDFAATGECLRCGWNQSRSKYVQQLIEARRS
jgi:hypothetical protein